MELVTLKDLTAQITLLSFKSRGEVDCMADLVQAAYLRGINDIDVSDLKQKLIHFTLDATKMLFAENILDVAHALGDRDGYKAGYQDNRSK